LLDPALLGEDLLDRNKRDLEDKLINTPADDFQPVDDARREMLYLQYTAFMIAVSAEKAANTFRYQLQVKEDPVAMVEDRRRGVARSAEDHH
jgi:hypothetical protein